MLSAFILAKNLSRNFPSVNSRFATEGNFRDTVFDKIDQHVEATGFDGNRAHDKGFMEEAKKQLADADGYLVIGRDCEGLPKDAAVDVFWK